MPKHEADAPPAAEVAADPLEGLKVGRVVYYWPHPHESINAAGPWAAIVTLVQYEKDEKDEPTKPSGVVNLNVQMPLPAPIGDDPVCRFRDVPYDEAQHSGTWSWTFAGQNTRYKPDRTA